MKTYTVRVFTRDAKIRGAAMEAVRRVCGKCYAKLDDTGVLLLAAKCDDYQLLKGMLADEILFSACWVY